MRPVLQLLIALVVAAILAFTLWPFEFSTEQVGHFGWQASLSDAIANIALFLPLGFLLRLFRQGSPGRWGLPELLVGAALSLAVESAQLYLPVRQSQYADILCNAGGSWLGALLAGFAIRQLALPRGNRLPDAAPVLLLALLLLTPLAWLNAPGIAPRPAPLASLLPLILAGGIAIGVLGGLLREDGYDLAPGASSMIAMGWSGLALLPYIEKQPEGVLASALLLGTTAPMLHWLTGRRLAGQGAVLPSATRPVLTLLVTLYLLTHLFLLAGATWQAWHWHIALLPDLDKSRGVSVVANLGTFVLLGYLLARHRGRRARWWRPCLQATGLGALLVLVSGWLPRPALSALELALLPACWGIGVLLNEALQGHRRGEPLRGKLCSPS